MMKKSAAHRVEKGIMLTARGYAMKARPGPTKIRMEKAVKKKDWMSCRSKMFEFLGGLLDLGAGQCPTHLTQLLPRWEHSVHKP